MWIAADVQLFSPIVWLVTLNSEKIVQVWWSDKSSPEFIGYSPVEHNLQSEVVIFPT